jgi:hypothetical protein
MTSASSPLGNKTIIEVLEDLQWARVEELVSAGASEAWAQMFALLEKEHRARLARELGPRKALLARLVWGVEDGSTWVRLEYDAPPALEDVGEFYGFL